MADQVKNKAEQPAAKVAEPAVYELKAPDGRKYLTSSRPEAENLHRTAGYEVVSPKGAFK